MPYKKTVAVCCENRKEHINTHCGQNALSLNVRPEFRYFYVFRGNQSNERVLAL